MDIQSILLLSSPTIVFILGCIIILVGLIGIALLALRREINSLVSISLMLVIFGLFLITIDRILIQYVDDSWLNIIQIIIIGILVVFYLFQNWKRN